MSAWGPVAAAAVSGAFDLFGGNDGPDGDYYAEVNRLNQLFHNENLALSRDQLDWSNAWKGVDTAEAKRQFDLGLGFSQNMFDAQFPESVRQFNTNFALQDELARSGVRMRVADAKAAGISPLVALGMQPMGGSPVYSTFPQVSAPGGTSSGGYVPGGSPTGAGVSPGSWGSGRGRFSNMGQHIGRAIEAALTHGERHTQVMQGLAETRGMLENELLARQLDNSILATKKQVGPPMPAGNLSSAMSSQGNGQGYTVRAVEIPATQPGTRTQEAGAMPETTWQAADDRGHSFRPMPSLSMYGEDQDIGNPAIIGYYLRNRLLPSAGFGLRPPPKSLLPKGATGWRWSTFDQAYKAVFGSHSKWDRWYRRQR